MKNIYKVIYLSALLLFVSNFIYSQSLYVVGPTSLDLTKDILEDWSVEIHSTVGNNTLTDINVKVKVKVLEIAKGHSFDVCWKGNCLPSTTEDWDKGDTDVIPAGQALPENSFFSHYYCTDKGSDPVKGNGKLLYTFYRPENQDDKAELTVTIAFTDVGSVSEFTSNPEISILHSMDNKLSISADNSGEYFVSLYSINGNNILNEKFNSSYQTDLNLLSSGVYLFNITKVNGERVSAGKIVIK